ncbi:hypothetical protein J6590_019594 [Homalodisca vitripennis]|nr:hypothetical protein J6590_019594 [Homalodisca vitripennis]
MTTAVPTTLPTTTNVAKYPAHFPFQDCGTACAYPGEFCLYNSSCLGRNYFCIRSTCQYRDLFQFAFDSY